MGILPALQKYFKGFLLDVDKQTLVVTILLAIFGWIIALFLQRSNAKHQHRIDILYDIYKQFVDTHKSVQNSLSQLGAQTSPPFILMEACMIPMQFNSKTEQQCVFEAEKQWRDFVNNLFKANSDFLNQYLELRYIFADWAAPLRKLIPVQDILEKTIGRIAQQINTNLKFLQSYETEHGHDWRRWNQKDIEKVLADIRDESTDIGTYLSDLIVMIHNNLLSKYFKWKRPIRATLDKKYKVLTPRGFINNINYKLIRKIRRNYDLLLKKIKGESEKSGAANDYKDILQAAIDRKCPNCKNNLEVIDIYVDEKSFYFNFICGHSWKGVNFNESFKIREIFVVRLLPRIISLKDGVFSALKRAVLAIRQYWQ